MATDSGRASQRVRKETLKFSNFQSNLKTKQLKSCKNALQSPPPAGKPFPIKIEFVQRPLDVMCNNERYRIHLKFKLIFN